VNPSFLVSYNAIKGYQELEDGRILVKLKPAPSGDVISEGEDAKFVKSLFNKKFLKRNKDFFVCAAAAKYNFAISDYFIKPTFARINDFYEIDTGGNS
jgi:hypothetical protein